MNNEKQDIDPRERLLDALNDPETSPEEWEELLSEEDNIQTLHLLRDCRKAFIREDASSKTDPNKAWDKFMQKRKVEKVSLTFYYVDNCGLHYIGYRYFIVS